LVFISSCFPQQNRFRLQLSSSSPESPVCLHCGDFPPVIAVLFVLVCLIFFSNVARRLFCRPSFSYLCLSDSPDKLSSTPPAYPAALDYSLGLFSTKPVIPLSSPCERGWRNTSRLCFFSQFSLSSKKNPCSFCVFPLFLFLSLLPHAQACSFSC